MHTATSSHEISQFFRECYIRWATGHLEPAMDEELNELSPPGWENWKQTIERIHGYRPGHFRQLQAHLRKHARLSSDQALAVMLRQA